MAISWPVNGDDPNHVGTGMILQVILLHASILAKSFSDHDSSLDLRLEPMRMEKVPKIFSQMVVKNGADSHG